MRKIILFLLFAVVFVACTEETEVFKIQKSQLVGEWVYDHPEEGVWEKQKFLESGAFYYSNDVNGDWSFSNDLNDGVYNIVGDNQVVCSFHLNGVAMTVDLYITDISDYSYTAEYFNGESLGFFTYARLLDSFEMNPKEKVIPDYANLVKTDIIGFKSHKTYVATVDPINGEITAVSSGRTYIDVITNEGTAVIEISVAGLWSDYTSHLGDTFDEIKVVYGTPYHEDSNWLFYKMTNDSYIDLLAFQTDSSNDKVRAISLVLRKDADWQKALDYLNEIYYYYEKGSEVEDNWFAFTNKKTLKESSIGITFDGKEGIVTYINLMISKKSFLTKEMLYNKIKSNDIIRVKDVRK